MYTQLTSEIRAEIGRMVEETNKRPWQAKGLVTLDRLIKQGNSLVSVEAVTGGGKTFLGCLVAASLLANNKADKILVIAPSCEIRKGWVDTLSKLGFATSAYLNDCGDKIGFATTYQGAAGKIDGSSDSMAKYALKLCDNRTVLLVDEAHHPERNASWGEAVDALSSQAGYTIALTGTPWKTAGHIALLEKQYKDGKLECDVRYTYIEDLRQNNDLRATVPAHFMFFDSKVKGLDDEPDVILPVPQESGGEYCMDSWRNLADANNRLPLSPHVGIKDNQLSNNRMARRMIDAGLIKLDAIKARTKNKAMMLIVAKSIKDARFIAEYMTEVQGLKTQVIVSDDDDSSEKLSDIRTGKTHIDVIVSVGMVSEGVDIPALKVLVYLSAITTLLYLVQVIGRVLRRINKAKLGEKPDYLDKTLEGNTAYVLMPAHPVLLDIGLRLEEDIRQALEEAKTKSDGDTGEQSELIERVNEGGNDIAETHRGHITSDIERKLVILESDPDAKDICGQQYRDWVYSTVASGHGDYVREDIDAKLDRFDIDIDEAETCDNELDYDTRVRLFTRDSVRLTSKIRFSVYAHISDDAKAYKVTRREINKCADIESFPKATLDEKQRWIDCANDMYRDYMAGKS